MGKRIEILDCKYLDDGEDSITLIINGEQRKYVPERTCRAVLPPYWRHVEEIAECSVCGRQLLLDDDDEYCPRCGAKVVDDDADH